MLKKSIAVAVLAFTAAAPAIAAPALPSFSSLAGGGRGMGAFALPAFPTLPSAGGSGAFLTTLKTGPATLLAVTPLSKSTEVLPRSGVGIRTYKFTKPSFGGGKLAGGKLGGGKVNLGTGKTAASQFAATLTSLPGTGLGVIKSGAGSINTLPADGVAQLKGLGL